MQVTARNIRALPAGRHSAGQTLTLLVGGGAGNGQRSWVQRLTINGVRRDIGLGPVALVTLREARGAALENRRDAYRGIDPTGRRRKARAVPTFREAAGRTFAAYRGRWRSEKTARGWDQQLERYAYPVLADLPVDQIDRPNVLGVLEPLWTSKPALAGKLRGRLRAIFEWAQAHGHVETNVIDLVAGALPAQTAAATHHRALPHGEVAAALRAVECSGSSLPARAALRFTILTACRSGEVRLASWAEVDVEAREWRIPASRMKSNREHRVPLSDAALAVLDTVRPLRGTGDLLFPSVAKPGAALSAVVLSRTLAAAGLGDRATVHGMRSAFRDWAADTGQPREVAEASLAHVVVGTEGSYFRSDLFDRRRTLLRDWAQYATCYNVAT